MNHWLHDFQVEEFLPLSQCPLYWRFSDARWNKLPEAALERIAWLNDHKTTELQTQVKTLVHTLVGDGWRLRESTHTAIVSISDRGTTGSHIVRSWLSEHIAAADELVSVTLNEMAFATTSEIFIAYWDDFCYPFDRVTVWPRSQTWTLAHYDEILQFGKRAG